MMAVSWAAWLDLGRGSVDFPRFSEVDRQIVLHLFSVNGVGYLS